LRDYPLFMSCALLLIGLAAGNVAADLDPVITDGKNHFTNGDFTKAAADGTPVGWNHRGEGKISIKKDGDDSYVELLVENGSKSSFIQQNVKLPDGVVKIKMTVTYRYADIVPGDRGYQRGKIQGRRLKGNDDTGNWIDIDSVAGTSEGWITKSRIAGGLGDYDGVMLRLALYDVKQGALHVKEARLEYITEAMVAKEREKYRPAEPFGPAVTDARFSRLQRGININNWFNQPYNAKALGKKGSFDGWYFDAYATDHDIKLIKQAGFDHIRLCIDPIFLMNNETGELKTDLLPHLDKAIAMIREYGLAVIVDVHPKVNAYKKFSKKPTIKKAFPIWWGNFARHMAETTDPEWVFLEILNEPGGQGFWVSSWPPYQDILLTVIRENAPKHTIIANSGAYMLAWEIVNHEPHPDRNVIYAFHYYEPSPFTHQGARWMKDWYHPLRQVPWPLTKDNVDEAIANIAAGYDQDVREKSASVLRDQVKSGWASESRPKEQMQKVAAWATKHDRRVVVGEFGVYTKYAPRESRLRYLEAVTKEMESVGFGWSLWEYCNAGYPIVTNPDAPSGERQLDWPVIEALGLNKAPAKQAAEAN